MSYPIAAIRTAVAECMEGTIGSAYVAPAGVFARGVFAGQPPAAAKAIALQTSTARCRFDVEAGPFRDHPATAQSVRPSRRIGVCDLTIRVVAKLATPAQLTQRDADIAEIVSALDDAVRALTYAGNVAATSAAVSTGIVGGAINAPDGGHTPEIVIDDEDWDGQLFNARILASAIVLATPVEGSA